VAEAAIVRTTPAAAADAATVMVGGKAADLIRGRTMESLA